MPANTKTPGEYSTNPSTVKSRRRRMNLSAEQKVEDAAKLADYKAMLHARNKVQHSPNFAGASESEKSTMLETAMRQTMEKRRARGQDTMSKMAAFRAGRYRDHGGFTGPATRVPISEFLRNNGFVPSPSAGVHQRGAAAGGRNTGHADQRPHTYMSQGPASVDDMEAVGSAFAGDENFTPNGRPASVPARPIRRNANPLESQSPFSPPPRGVKRSPGSFAIMTPEPMLSSIEGDVPMTDAGESLTRLQIEMRHLRTISENVAANNKHIRDVELGNIEAKMGMEESRVRDLEVKYKQLEGVVHALQNTSLGNIVDRVNELESIVEDLQAKVGSGCDAEVAKMREVMGGLKNSLDKVGGFI